MSKTKWAQTQERKCIVYHLVIVFGGMSMIRKKTGGEPGALKAFYKIQTKSSSSGKPGSQGLLSREEP